MKQRETHRHISDYWLERYLLGELPPEELESMRREAERDEGLRTRLEALQRSNQELREQYPPAWMARKIRGRLEGVGKVKEAKGIFSTARFWAVPVAAAAALLVVAVPTLFGPEEGDRDTRIKGLEPHLEIFRKTTAGSEGLEEGSLVREGDLVQIVYQASGEKYGAILSVDGRGTMTLHLPSEGKHAIELQQGGQDTLGFSYELDNAPRWERFYFVTADIPFDIPVVKRAIRQAEEEEELALPRGFKQHVFTLKKASDHD